MTNWILASIGILVAAGGLVASILDLNKYQPHPVTHRLAVRCVMLWVIILLEAIALGVKR